MDGKILKKLIRIFKNIIETIVVEDVNIIFSKHFHSRMIFYKVKSTQPIKNRLSESLICKKLGETKTNEKIKIAINKSEGTDIRNITSTHKFTGLIEQGRRRTKILRTS